VSPAALIGVVLLAQSQASPLQARVDAAADGATIVVDAGRYVGDLTLDRPVHLLGRGRPLLVGSGDGSVVRIRAAGVVFEGFDIDGRLGGSLDRDSSGVHVAAPGAIIRDVRISQAFFGVYLREADGALVEKTTVRGVPDRPAGEQGSALHVYDSKNVRLVENDLADMRDGVYIQSSDGTIVHGNIARRVRYGLHYMYSDDNVFEDNLFEDGAAGAAIMFSKRVTFRRNRFVHNRGFASVGLLLKDCEDLVAEDNLIADNARGLFLEGSDRNTFRRNLIAVSDAALVLFGSSRGNIFEGNAFVANLTPLELVGRRTDTRFDGNYWSDADEPDLDGDGVRDRPFRISNVFDHFRGNLTAAELFARGPAARALAAAERTFPVLSVADVTDPRPLVRMPHFTALPAVESGVTRTRARLGLMLSGGALLGGAGLFRFGRVRDRRRPR
jgi:nitrous oxidase accessory protein